MNVMSSLVTDQRRWRWSIDLRREPTFPAMDDQLLSTKEAAQRLGISVLTLYGWLGLSDVGQLLIRGQQVTIRYFQTGPRGQGRIRIDVGEVERIKELMRVCPQHVMPRLRPIRRDQFPGITVPLGRPTKSGV